ncbi:hypothetical protein DB44_EH00070 [Candidatus Protochlamydia amoebophila]|uniref:Uncharacterized protein n=1 Tax=Candidatus Protochlamydia amoebophila TaxID=362787 RepID=A0A0C1JII1_9BACT|nr:hypothetical protein DB44_EH00070 [Candidatus Protochlamydia amoebophila]
MPANDQDQKSVFFLKAKLTLGSAKQIYVAQLISVKPFELKCTSLIFRA